MLELAGAELAAAGSNNSALAWFGLRWIQNQTWRSCLARLSEHGLPQFTAPSTSQIEENSDLVGSLLVKRSKCPERRLVLAFDRTYLHPCSQLTQLSSGHCLLGGPHRPENFELPSEAEFVIKKCGDGEIGEVTVQRARNLATEMECCIVWDPSRRRSPTFDLASFPVLSSASLDPRFEEAMAAVDAKSKGSKKFRGCWETLLRLGSVLLGATNVRHIVADAAGAHKWVSQWLLGLAVPLSDEMRQHVPFFRDLHFKDLPICCMPVGVRVAYHGSESIHFWSGVAHSQKNIASQLRSPLRTIHWGDLWSDHSGSLIMGLFPSAYIGTDEMR